MPTSTYTKIATSTLTTSGGFDFTNIPNTYTDLVLTGQLRAAGGASIVENAWWYYNNDSSANYGDMRGLFYTGGFLSTNGTGDTQCTFGAVCGPGSAGHFFTSFLIVIHDYAATNKYRTSLTQYITENYEANHRTNVWLNTNNAVSRMTFYCGGAGNLFATGSTITIWGIKAEA